MKTVLLAGRICYSLIFILSGLRHFAMSTIAYAGAMGVPFPAFFVPLSGLLALLGGLSVALGLRAREGAWLLVLFLVPVTLTMHRFWGLADPQASMIQYANFMKNLSMLGGAFIISYYGAGPYSMDSRKMRREIQAASEPRVPVHA